MRHPEIPQSLRSETTPAHQYAEKLRARAAEISSGKTIINSPRLEKMSSQIEGNRSFRSVKINLDLPENLTFPFIVTLRFIDLKKEKIKTVSQVITQSELHPMIKNRVTLAVDVTDLPEDFEINISAPSKGHGLISKSFLMSRPERELFSYSPRSATEGHPKNPYDKNGVNTEKNGYKNSEQPQDNHRQREVRFVSSLS